ncbi:MULTISPECIES: DNA repair protein [unclassified Agarivorans]|uniref:DNA repair protein n=1 Tax=unclassified Agarivorans TaxID=2636026 RepID=UPI003D7D2DBA
MVFTLILLGVGTLLFLVIGYNMVQQFKQKQETERRLAIAKQKAIINETEELLLHSSILPYSKELVETLHSRILQALNHIRTTDPTVKGLNNRIRATKGQLSQIKGSGGEVSDSAFRAPDTDKDALQMLQIVKKIRAVVRSEHAKGRLNTQVFVLEDRRLELMQLKINIENALKRAIEAQALRQWGSARQLLNKSISALSNISDRDAYLEQKLTDMKRMNSEMSEKLKSASQQQVQDLAEKETDELDVLFQPKKKW